MNRGVSLISLIITIVAVIILASVTIFNSLDTIDDAQIAKMQKEFNDVADFVRTVSSKAEADLIDLSLSYDTLATEAQLASFYVDDAESEFTAEAQNKIKALNDSVIESGKNAKYGYHFVTGKQIENGISGIDINSNLEGVENNYIINFYYGTVVAKISPNQSIYVGTIK